MLIGSPDVYGGTPMFGRARHLRFCLIITISAKRKLSVYDGPHVPCTVKDPHGRNKFLGISYCRYMLHNDLTDEFLEPFVPYKDWIGFFESVKKKDDIADAFLQGAWYLRNSS